MKKIYVTKEIYRQPDYTGYLLNVNEPTLNILYRKYKEHKKLPSHYPMTDKQRMEFERLIKAMIESGKIVVRN